MLSSIGYEWIRLVIHLNQSMSILGWRKLVLRCPNWKFHKNNFSSLNSVRYLDVFCCLKLIFFVRQLIRILFIPQLFVLVMFHYLNHKIEYRHSLLFLNRMRWIAGMLKQHSGLKFWTALHWGNIVWSVEACQLSGSKINLYLVKKCRASPWNFISKAGIFS